MCGIFGKLATNSQAIDQTLAASAVDVLKHRGPDDDGTWYGSFPSGTLLLGHTRLSILDLSSAGHQPMSTDNERLTIAFNGEIYNYKEIRAQLATRRSFRTHTDTEVLLAAWEEWGVGCIPMLKGMFAFAIVDRAKSVLTLVRDGFGIKPLYYQMSSSSLIFASEIRGVLALSDQPPSVNETAAAMYLSDGVYDHGSETMFENVKSIPPGTYVEIELTTGNIGKVHRWWNPSIAQIPHAPGDAEEKLRQLLLDSVKLHLRSDVPLGVALSGGIDSSLITCFVRHLEPNMEINTFSYVPRNTPFDESKWIKIVNDATNSVSHIIEVSEKQLSQDIDDLIQHQGEPFGSTSIYAQYAVYKCAANVGIKVILDGQGADELFAGYNGYPEARIHNLVASGNILSLIKFIKRWSRLRGRSVPYGLLRTIQALLPEKQRRAWSRRWRSKDAASWVRTDVKRNLDLSSSFSTQHELEDGRRLSSILRRELTGGGLQALLRHGDRNSMRWSIESRVPFLLTEIAEFALSLDETDLLSSDGVTKAILRKATRGIAPPSILERHDKIGFITPQNTWINREFIENSVDLDALSELSFVDVKSIKASISLNQSFGNVAFWRLVNLSKWYTAFFKKNPHSALQRRCAGKI